MKVKHILCSMNCSVDHSVIEIIREMLENGPELLHIVYIS
jgi:hypothetical protein